MADRPKHPQRSDPPSPRAGEGDRPKGGGMAPAELGRLIKRFRKDRDLSLSELAGLTGISEPTLSRVENGQTLISAHNLYILSKVLSVDITAFFEGEHKPIGAGIRSVCRRSDAVRLKTARYLADVLCTDLANKRMHPSLNIVTIRSVEQAGGFSRHEGEEFIHVIAGRLTLATEFYEPLTLEPGDSVYIDSRMGHAYLSTDGGAVEILVVTTIETASARGAGQR